MPRIKAFRALRPIPARAAEVASVPYDVVNREEAAALAAGNPLSFLHVVRPDIDVPESTDPYDARVYETGRRNLLTLVQNGILQQDGTPGLFVYRQIMGGNAQHGIVCCCHVDDYEHNLILKHEKTRKVKEDDRTRHMLALGVHPGPVFLTYRDVPQLRVLVASTIREAPLYDFTATDGVQHTVWSIAEADSVVAQLSAVRHFYVADGHHRAASAWRAAGERRAANPAHTGDEEYNWFLSVLFPASELRILAYNRVVRDLNGKSASQVLDELTRVGSVTSTDNPLPPAPGSFCVYLDHRWWLVSIPQDSIPQNDAIASLDVALVESRVLEPIFGIGDVRTDPRIDFVGGIRGPAELERLVSSGKWAVGLSMYPTSIAQLMAVSDAGQIMPPKSTWFEPKLRSGLLVHPMD